MICYAFVRRRIYTKGMLYKVLIGTREKMDILGFLVDQLIHHQSTANCQLIQFIPNSWVVTCLKIQK